MSGLLNRRASWRRSLRLSYRGILGFVLLATQALVPALLAEPGYYSWKALAEVATVQINSGGKVLMGCRILDGKTIITCAHGIGDEQAIFVSGIGMDVEKAVLIAKDEREDMAILRVNAPGIPFKMYFGQGTLPVGYKVIQGYKLQSDERASAQVTEVVDHMRALGRENLALDSKPVEGYSGGPIFLANGQLVGITKGEAVFKSGDYGTEAVAIWKFRELLP